MAHLIVAIVISVALAAGVPSEHAAAKRPLGFAGGCAVTLPNAVPPPSAAAFGPESFNYGDAKIRVHLWPKGVLLVGQLPGGGSYATLDGDGAIHAKLGWWRGVRGKLEIVGRRLDKGAPRLGAYIPAGYGARGFQPSGLVFPTLGCWRVVGSVGSTRLAFVVRLRKA